MSGRVLFECQSGNSLWRFSIYRPDGRERLSVWPCFRKGQGDWHPCKAAFAPRGGFTVPLDSLGELHAALGAYLATNAPGGPSSG